jgi:hypothetical protein
MRIINIVEVADTVVLGVLSFIVYEEQLSNDVIEEAEKVFKEIVSKHIDTEDGVDMDDLINSYLEDGVYYSNGYSCSIVWSFSTDN